MPVWAVEEWIELASQPVEPLIVQACQFAEEWIESACQSVEE